MDLSSYDIRTSSEDGAFCHLKDPYTGEELYDENDKPVGFMVLGNASKSAQEAMRRIRTKTAKKKVSDDDGIEGLHTSSINTASALIIKGVGLDIKGEEVGANPEMIKRALGLTFPEIRQKVDANGEPRIAADGTPMIGLVNDPFAMQIINFASDQGNFLGE